MKIISRYLLICLFFYSGVEARQEATVVEQTVMSITAVVNGASFEAGIAAGSWVSIFGTNLAPTTRLWGDVDFVDDNLPSNLDGVSVFINGKSASVSFISPGQLNVQAPDDDALGPVSVEVVRDGIGSAMGTAELQAVSPAFFLFDPEARKYVAAIHPDGVHAGKADLFGGAVPTRVVKPGDIVLLYGTGFGATNPAVQPGKIFVGAAPLIAQPRIFFGGVEAEVQFGGLSGAGLNQFNVVVPEGLLAGDVAVWAQVMGLQTQTDAFVTITGGAPPPGPGIIVISQIYGGGGNQGAVLANDFVELFNRSASPVDVTGWSVQHASAKGTTWDGTDLVGTIQPGQYFLLQEGKGQSGDGDPLPTPDVEDEVGFSATTSKVALVRTTDLLSGDEPTDSSVADFVGYGAGVSFSEGTPAPSLPGGNKKAIIRAGDGCVDTNDNGSDFSTADPMPRNRFSPLNVCE